MELRKRSLLSSADPYIDLSMIDNSGVKRSSMTTANCYMVHQIGKYKLPLVYGNAIKNGATNTESFYTSNSGDYVLSRFVNHSDTGITDPWLKNNGAIPTSAQLLWQDSPGLITEVAIQDDYLKFSVGTFTPGNAVISVKNSSGTILWSWHIWITSETYTNTTSVNTGSKIYNVAPVNLGWIPGSNSNHGVNTYFQFGRKDPLIPAASYDTSDNRVVYDINNNSVTGIIDGSSQYKTVGEVIQNPITMYYGNDHSAFTKFYANLWDINYKYTSGDGYLNMATNTKKTIYDPCPPGFCIPTSNLYYFMYNNSSGSATAWDYGAYWTYSITGNSLWFPALGCRYPQVQGVANSFNNGYYFSSVPMGNCVYMTNLYFYNNSNVVGWGRTNFGLAALGYCIRPVTE